MSRFGRLKMVERKAISASLAAPSTGGAASRTSKASPRVPATAVRPALGTTRTAKTVPDPEDVSGILTRRC
jgi:hypothetical protein